MVIEKVFSSLLANPRTTGVVINAIPDERLLHVKTVAHLRSDSDKLFFVRVINIARYLEEVFI